MAEDEFVEVKIDWEPDPTVAKFANHLLVNFDGAVFTLRFFQVLPPTAFNSEAMREIESVPGRHVATLVVAKETMPSFADVLNRMVERFSQGEQLEQP